MSISAVRLDFRGQKNFLRNRNRLSRQRDYIRLSVLGPTARNSPNLALEIELITGCAQDLSAPLRR